MKKIYLSLLGIIISLGLSAQLFNLDLETWSAGSGYDDPDGWTTINQYAAFVGANPNVVKLTSNVSQGSAAAEMFTQPCPGCASFGAPDTLPGLLVQQTGYYSNTATNFVFDYQYEGVNGDWGAAVAELTVWDATGDTAIVIARAVDTMAATQTTWATKNLSFVYDFPSLTPDTINIYFVSSARDLAQDPTFPAPQDGSTLRVDDVKIIDPATASINENIADIKIFSYQNIISINTTALSATNYQVVDLTGKSILSGLTSGTKTRIDGNHLSPGVYLVSVGEGNQKNTQKIIIE